LISFNERQSQHLFLHCCGSGAGVGAAIAEKETLTTTAKVAIKEKRIIVRLRCDLERRSCKRFEDGRERWVGDGELLEPSLLVIYSTGHHSVLHREGFR